MVNKKLKSIIETQMIKGKESKHITIKNYQFTKKDSKRGGKDKVTTKQLENNEQNGDLNPYLWAINLNVYDLNYLIKRQNGWMDTEIIPNYMLPTRDSLKL